MPESPRRPVVLLYALLTLPFLVNDLANIHVRDAATWLLIDYAGAKALPLAVLAVCLARGCLTRDDLGLNPMPLKAFLGYALVLAATGTALDQWGYALLDAVLPETRLGSIPVPESGLLQQFDLWAGLAMVAVVEELIFRGLARAATQGLVLLPRLALTGLVFGAIHWSAGLPAIVITGTIGVLFMLVLLRTGSIYPGVAAHFAVNFVDFSGLWAAAT